MDRQRNNRRKQLLASYSQKAFPILALGSFLLFVVGIISYFSASDLSVPTITSSASEGARIQAIQEKAESGETAYEYKTDQLPPPMASQ